MTQERANETLATQVVITAPRLKPGSVANDPRTDYKEQGILSWGEHIAIRERTNGEFAAEILIMMPPSHNSQGVIITPEYLDSVKSFADAGKDLGNLIKRREKGEIISDKEIAEAVKNYTENAKNLATNMFDNNVSGIPAPGGNALEAKELLLHAMNNLTFLEKIGIKVPQEEISSLMETLNPSPKNLQTVSTAPLSTTQIPEKENPFARILRENGPALEQFSCLASGGTHQSIKQLCELSAKCTQVNIANGVGGRE